VGIIGSYFKMKFNLGFHYYEILGYRIFLALTLSLIVGILDGIGLSMFLPLLQMISGEENFEKDSMGGLMFIVDFFENKGIIFNLNFVLFLILFFFLFKGIFRFIEAYYNVLIQQFYIKKLRYQSVNKLATLKYEAFINIDPGKVQNTLGGEMNRISQGFKSYFLTIQSIILVLVYLFLAFLTNPQFAILVSIGGGVSNFLYKSLNKKTKQISRKISQGGNILQGFLLQIVDFYKYLKATSFIDKYKERVLRSIDYIESSNKKIGLYNSILTASREPIVIVVVVIVILLQVKVLNESLGGIVLSLLFFYRSLNSLVLVQNHWNIFLNMTGSIENFNTLINNFEENQDEIVDSLDFKFSESIELKNINFNYGSSKILNGINLKIEKNKTYAFIGESGSGKTTLVNLIVGLIKSNSGQFFIDNTSIYSIDIKKLQQKVGYITQDPVIFSDSIYNNITLWAPLTKENLKKFEDVLKKASIFDFVQTLEEKENTILGNNGIQLSGGQRQRISIARELFKEIEILIMDEATSALDSETERIIQSNIDQLKGEYTILIVAHRLSTIKNSDCVILMDKGKILDQGEFKELALRVPKFRKMIELQEI
jgi:ABC-type multidrug transport system fused ATPase/permease subunit